MSRPELVQCVLDIKSWFMRTKCASRIGEAATPVQLQRLNKAVGTPLPESFLTMMGEVNGGLYFMEKEMLDSERIMDIMGDVESSKRWKSGLIPFAGDEGCLYAIDTKENDEIVEWDADDGVGDILAPNLSVFLEDYRNNLLSAQYEYVDGVGVLQKMTRPTKSGK